MRRARGGGFLGTALLALLCGGFAVIVFFELEPPLADPGARAATRLQQKPALAAASEPRFTMSPLRDFGEVLARPVFSETRRPPAPEAAAPGATAPFALVGVVLSAKERHALLEHGLPPHIDRVAEGQEVDGWTLEAVQLDRVVLRRGDNRVEVKAKDKAPTPAPQQRRAAAASPPAPPPSRGAQLPSAPPAGASLPALFGDPTQQ
ncbi:MAG TPA: hypothetical protein VGU20_32560 [Stellaceae bacterium]|nr:hypothetical protein [Stellaceae bacterium]